MKTKKEVLEYIKEHNKEFGGKLVTENGFKKYFPDLYKEMIETVFPKFFENFDFKQKLWHFLRDDYTEHFCNCGGKLKFRSFWFGYNNFCKMNCPSMVKNQIECVKEKNKNRTEKDKKEIQKKVKETFLKNYGVERYSQTKEWKEKTILKNREKFGYDWVSQSKEYKEKFKKTNLEKYGVENPMFNEEIKNKWKKNYDELIVSTLFEKYDDIISIDGDILVCKCKDEECSICKEKQYTTNKRTFYNRKSKNIDTCTKRTPIGSIYSGEELFLLNFIKSIYDDEIIENDRSILNGKELDIYLPKLKIAFEFNGIYWHSEIYKEINYHQKKSLLCKENGIRLFHIWEDDWIFKNEIIKDFIKSKLSLCDNNIGARLCEIRDVDNKVAINFLNENHIQGSVKNGKSIGLYYNNELVEIFTFGKLRKNMGGKPIENQYEIYRVCSKIGYNIQGGFSKLLNFFEKNYFPYLIITYANLDYSYGDVYKKCGFKEVGISKPVYTWVVDGIRKYRSNFMKSKLKECKENPTLTESQVMYSRKSWKCWDAGKIKFIKVFINNI